MKKRDKLKNLHKRAAHNLLDLRGLLTAICEIEYTKFPVNTLIELAQEKTASTFSYIEKCRKILKIID